MADRKRFARAETSTRTLDGAERTLYAPRAPKAQLSDRRLPVEGGERLDRLAHATLGDPQLWWRIADANPTQWPEELLVPGQVLDIPAED